MNVVADMLLTEPAPVTIWAALLLAATLSVLVMARADSDRHPHRALLTWASLRPRHHARAERRRRDAVQAVRYADEVGHAAQRAGQAARRWHEHWQQSEHRVDAAWHAWQAAGQRLADRQPASAFSMPPARTPADYADRERFLHRAVHAAVDRGDLPAAALTDARTGRGTWNPWLHPAEQEIAVLRAVSAHRHHVYLRAVTAERTARHDARLACEARDSLHREAAAAVTRAAPVRHLVSAGRRRTAPALRPVFAAAA